jgi:RND family efflux transporter MFP subunit
MRRVAVRDDVALEFRMPQDRSTRKWLIIPPIAIGVLVVLAFRLNARAPERNPPAELRRTLRVIEAPRIDVTPRVLGYGTARAADTWRAVAEVKGRVTETHAELRQGAFLNADDLVVRIDTRDYELAVAQLDAEIAEARSRLNELEKQTENDRASLGIEQASLTLAQSELDRVQGLSVDEMAAVTELRSQKRTVLTQQQKVQSLENALNLVPSKRDNLEAALALSQARLERAQLDLAKTVIRAPFACRIRDVAIEPGQFLNAGEVLFEADGTSVTEVDVQVPIDRARNLLRAYSGGSIGHVPDMNEMRRVFDVAATVRLRTGDVAVDWEARFTGVREQLDPVTRTIGLIVAVDDPYAKAVPGQRPPLLPGTFCEVEMRGRSVPDRVVVPRASLSDGHVYVVDGDNRLRRRDLTVLFAQADFVCIETGLEPGERVAVSDPTPAIEGMLIDPVFDETVLAALLAEAQTQAASE